MVVFRNIFFIFVSLSILIHSKHDNDDEKIINVHILPHSHNDPGWKVTTDLTFILIKIIIDETIDYLLTDEAEKVVFNWVEGIFLHMWWNQATKEKRNDLLHLIHITKQWRIVMGGWVMNDQACTTYMGSIQQMTIGHNWLKEVIKLTEDEMPKEGFTIDPFGLSNVQTHLYYEMGFENHVVSRIPYYVRDELLKEKKLEFKWVPFESSPKEEYLLSHVLYFGYHTRSPFEWWVMDKKKNPPITDENIEKSAKILIERIEERRKIFLTNQVLFLFGADVAFWRPKFIFENMNKLINYINKEYNETYHLKYSTINQYFDAIRNEKVEFPTIVEKDFFVYIDGGTDKFESGYYVSQPRLKIESRKGEKISKFSEMIYSLSYLFDNRRSSKVFSIEDFDKYHQNLFHLRDKAGQLYHHDAITGTERWSVSDDYLGSLDLAMMECVEGSKKLLSYLISADLFVENKKKEFLHFKNIPVEEFVKFGDKIGFFVFNSLGWVRNSFVKLRFSSVHEHKHIQLRVTEKNETISVPVEFISTEGLEKEVIIKAENIPAFGFKYLILHVEEQKSRKKERNVGDTTVSIVSNSYYDVYFDQTTNKINRIVNKKSKIDMKVNADFYYYPSNAVKGEQNSGKYIFKPSSDDKPIQISESCDITKVIDNDLVVEVYQTFSNYIKIITRLYKGETDSNFIEIQFEKLGELPKDHEVIIKFQTEIDNGKVDKVIYHDEMALQTKRKTFEYSNTTMIVPRNFWPTQYSAFIKDSAAQFSVLSSKTNAVASFEVGEIELMLHRRTSMGDHNGDTQALNDKFVFKMEDEVSLRLILDTPENSVEDRRLFSYDVNFPLEIFPFKHEYWNMNNNYRNTLRYPADFQDKFSFIKEDTKLPNEIHLLSFDRINPPSTIDDNAVIVRFVNICEDFDCITPTKIDMADLFIFNVTEIRENSLSLMYDKGRCPSQIALNPYDVKTYRIKF